MMSISKDIEEARAKQQAEKAAELKAKFDMVRAERKPSYGRAPRKIGEMVCDTGIKRGHRQETARFVLRLDTDTGEFTAEHGDTWYISKSRDALQARMNEVARVTLDLKWNRYIVVEYKADVPYRDNWNSTTTLSIEDKRDKKPILGLNLAWEVVEYSDPVTLPGDDGGVRYMKRDVDEFGEPNKEQESKKELPAGLVPYSKEREKLLQNIRNALTSIDKKMVELLKGTPEQVAKRLDAAQGVLLLAPPTPPKKRSDAEEKRLRLLEQAEAVGWDSEEGMKLRAKAKR